MATLTAPTKTHASGVDTSVEERNEIVLRNMALVRFVARKVASSYGLPSGVEMGDLVSYGILGLLDAHNRYDATRNVTFETFAVPRIRGAILDELRRYDWIPRNVRARARQLNETVSTLANQLGRSPTRDEVAQGLGLDNLNTFERNSVPATVVGLDDLVSAEYTGDAGDVLIDAGAPEPGSALEDAETRSALLESLGTLPERDRLVLTLYYFEQVPLADIAKLLNVTESRVSQLHTRALQSLRERLTDA